MTRNRFIQNLKWNSIHRRRNFFGFVCLDDRLAEHHCSYQLIPKTPVIDVHWVFSGFFVHEVICIAL